MNKVTDDLISRTEAKDYREKIIKGLERCLKHTCPAVGSKEYLECEYTVGRYCRQDILLHDILALLKAQEPMEPVVDIDTWKCGNCGHTLEHQELLGDNVLFHEQYNYCPECGKAVKWK